MIDLRYSDLPAALEVDGEVFAIKTDFRTWLAWLESLEVNGIAEYGIFESDIPQGDSWVEVAQQFALSAPVTPVGKATETVQAFDFIRDGDYIVGSFQQAYGIDLTDPSLSMHWHRFLALFRSLPETCIMSKIMGYRTFKKADKDDYNKSMEKAKRAYTLPQKHTFITEQKAVQDKAIDDWADWAFGKATL